MLVVPNKDIRRAVRTRHVYTKQMSLTVATSNSAFPVDLPILFHPRRCYRSLYSLMGISSSEGKEMVGQRQHGLTLVRHLTPTLGHVSRGCRPLPTTFPVSQLPPRRIRQNTLLSRASFGIRCAYLSRGRVPRIDGELRYGSISIGGKQT